MKIMLVEDEALSAMLLKHTLRQFGCEDIHVFARGEKALAACASLQPDLVLMDIMLAGSDAIQANSSSVTTGFMR